MQREQGGRAHSCMSGGRHSLNSASSTRSKSSTVDSSQVRPFLKRASLCSSRSVDHHNSRPESSNSVTSSGYWHSASRQCCSERVAEATAVQQQSTGRSRLLVSQHHNSNGGRPVPPASSLPPGHGEPHRRPRSHYVGQVVFQLDELVYVGGIEAANNANLLCRLNIEYLIDVSNVAQADLPRSKRSDCPCLCAKETQHSRATLTVDINQNSTHLLTDNFAAANAFIDKARAHAKCALIHSYDGKNRAAVFAVQYLMAKHRLGRERAEALCQELLPRMAISDNFQQSLRRWESLVANSRRPGTTGQQQQGTTAAVTNAGAGCTNAAQRTNGHTFLSSLSRQARNAWI